MNYRPSSFIIAREAWPFAIPVALLALVLGVVSSRFHSSVGWTLTVLLALILAYVIAFFRNPQRSGPPDASAVYAPADGKVVSAGTVAHPEFPDGQALRVAIFMNLFNVHVNWAPLAATVTAAAHHSGKFINAMHDKCGDENERKVLAMRASGGMPVVVKLVAGLVARRIVCPLAEGDQVQRGEKIGLIRFGSRVEVFLPASCGLNVSVGQHVRGGESVIATLTPSSTSNVLGAGSPERTAQSMADAPVSVPAGS